MKYQVELTVSIGGTVEIEAKSIQAARKQAEKIQGTFNGDVALVLVHKAVELSLDFTEDGMDPYVEIEGIFEADEEDKP